MFLSYKILQAFFVALEYLPPLLFNYLIDFIQCRPVLQLGTIRGILITFLPACLRLPERLVDIVTHNHKRPVVLSLSVFLKVGL